MDKSRKWWCKYSWIAGLSVLSLLHACSEKSPQSAPVVPSGTVTTVTYRISSFPGKQKPETKDLFLTVSFDGGRSVTRELSGISGFHDTVTFYRKTGDSLMIASQQLPWRTVLFRVKDEHTPLIPDSLIPTLTNETATLLGYASRKAVFRQGDLKWEVWFTSALNLHDSTQVLIAHRTIKGTILKVIRSYTNRKSHAATVYEVTNLQLGLSESDLQFPSENKVYSGDDPRSYFLNEFDSLTAIQDTIPWQFKDRFLGKWQLENGPTILAVERYGEVYVASLRNYDPQKQRYEKANPVTARFYNNKLWFFDGNTWQWLEFCEDRLCYSGYRNRFLRRN